MSNFPTRRAWLGATLATAVWLGGCAVAPQAGGLAQIDALLKGADPGMGLSLSLQATTVTIGDPVRALVSTNRPAYLYLYQVAGDGQRVNALFPNAVDGANYIAAGSLMLPRDTWRMSARGPAGQSYFVVVATAEPMDLNLIARETAAGRIPVPARAYAAAMSPLREVAR
ncbi:MAG: DUF4384 domain-containing protein [Hydrogenophaga sp.]|jgi:hypothetical protein|nr:DUF4384 domain-containing protein [Hydrogenophaga sp.]